MSMVINNNIPALQTYNIVNGTSNALQKSIAKLSSGLRINSAADDAAGLAISEKMRAQIGGLDRAVANTQDGISLIQTAEGALQETHSILQRMRELSVQAANDTLTQQDRSYIQVEIDQLNEEITRIGNTTQFNKKKLLNGDSAALWSSDNNETKAIINGGLRTIDQFGQKSSVEGNYKIRIKADPGQGEVQKSDIMKIKHENVIMNKSVNSDYGVTDVAVTNIPAGAYALEYADSGYGATATLTGAYGIGGTSNSITTENTFTATTSPVKSISIQTTDGVEIWSTSGADIFGATNATEDMQIAYIMGGTAQDADQVDHQYTGVIDEIVAAARQKGINITDSSGAVIQKNAVTDPVSGQTLTLTTTTVNKGDAPNLKIVYDGGDATPTITDPGTNAPQQVTPESLFTVNVGSTATDNASVLFEVQAVDAINNTITLKATATKLSQNGVNSTAVQDNIILQAGGANTVDLDKIFGGTAGDTVDITFTAADVSAIQDTGKFVYHITPDNEASNTEDIGIQVNASMDSDWDGKWDGGPYRGQSPQYSLNGEQVADTEIHLKSFALNEKTGEVTEGDIILSTDSTFNKTNTNGLGGAAAGDILASFDATYIGKVADGDVKLRDLDKFWNSEGVFMLDDAKTITLNQGNGKTADVTLYAYDTLDDVAKKFNDAIANGLGQAKYVDDATKFSTYVTGATNNSESVDGTFLLRSVVPGKSGEITLSGDEDLLNAFSLNTIQSSKETSYTVDIMDAHTGDMIKQSEKITGNVFYGAIGDNVDIEFSALSGISATWNDNLNKYTYSSTTEETTLHLADNTTVLQIGANEGEDLGLNIGDMRGHALGLDGVNVMSHDRAARSITIIDNAIDKVSTQRANLGAYQNRLEYTASNLTTASENLTSAESRIRDTDMAKEMMNFTKLNIMLARAGKPAASERPQPDPLVIGSNQPVIL